METLKQQEARLAVIRKQLLSRFERQFGSEERNPVYLLDRLELAMKRCARLQGQVQELSCLKEELFWELESRGQKLVKLEGLRGACCGEGNEEAMKLLSKVVSLNQEVSELAIENPSHFAPSSRRSFDEVDHGHVSLNDEKENERHTSKSNELFNEDIQKLKQNPYDIDEGTFLGLPDSVRGRAKFSDVKRTMSIIVEEFQNISRRSKDVAKGGKCEPISLKELDRLGGKCVGHTGANVLATLRALGLIDTSRAGVRLI